MPNPREVTFCKTKQPKNIHVQTWHISSFVISSFEYAFYIGIFTKPFFEYLRISPFSLLGIFIII